MVAIKAQLKKAQLCKGAWNLATVKEKKNRDTIYNDI
jgi:hypothetical protein